MSNYDFWLLEVADSETLPFLGVNGPTALSGKISVQRNTLLRAGNGGDKSKPQHYGYGAIMFQAENQVISNVDIHIKDVDIIDSSYSAIHYYPGQEIRGITYENVFINGTGTFVLELEAPSHATFINVNAINVRSPGGNPVHSCQFKQEVTKQGRNSGWETSKPFCNDAKNGQWPEPKWPWQW